MCCEGFSDFWRALGHCIRTVFLCCYGWVRECINKQCRGGGTYSSTSDPTLKTTNSISTIGLSDSEVLSGDEPPRPSCSRQKIIKLSTVEEERSSELSNNSVADTAIGVADIVSLTFSTHKNSPKHKSEQKKGSIPNSPRKSPKGSAEEETSFIKVKERRNRKNNSPDKPSASTSPSINKESPKQQKKTPPRSPSSAIVPYEPHKFTSKPSRSGDSSITYAQIISSPTVEIVPDSETNLLSLKEPEPPITCRQYSSESNTGSPIIFQAETIVHRADSNNSVNSEVTSEKQQDQGQAENTEEKEEQHNLTEEVKFEEHPEQLEGTEGVTQTAGLICFPTNQESEGGSGAEKTEAEETKEERKQLSEASNIIGQEDKEDKTDSDIKKEDSTGGKEAEINVESIDSSINLSLSREINKICNEFLTTQDNQRVPSYQTLADVHSDILDSNPNISDYDDPQNSRSEDFSSSRSEQISGEQILDPNEVKIEVDPCTTQSISTSGEGDSALLGYKICDESVESLEEAARKRRISEPTDDIEDLSEKTDSSEKAANERNISELIQSDIKYKELSKDSSEKTDSLEDASKQRNISEPAEDEQKVKKTSPSKDPVAQTEESTKNIETKADRKKAKKRRYKANKKKAQAERSVTETPSSSFVPPNTQEENPSSPIVSEEIEEEEKIIAEEEEIENQAIPEMLQQNEQDEICDHLEKSLDLKEEMEILEEKQIRILTLNFNDDHEKKLYRLRKNWIIEFRRGASLFGREINIHCNFPEEKNGELKEFSRNTYQLLRWLNDGKSSDDTAFYAQIVCKIAGTFRYYMTEKNGDNEVSCGSGYFLVDPNLTYGYNEHLPLDSIQCHTVISKNLGSFSTWESKLKVSKETSYNMIHFTPIQELGASNSAYCLNDQLKINPSFRKENGDKLNWDELRVFIQKIRREWKIASICDIVLNHTANETPWIKEHIDATYNCLNCKYMRPAYLLDAALFVFQEDVRKGMYETRGIPSIIDKEEHLGAIRYYLKENVLKKLKLHELFICDVNYYVSKFMEMARRNQPQQELEENMELSIKQDADYKRLASSVDMDLALKIYNIYRPGCFDEDARLRRSCEEFKQKIDSLNQIIIDRIEKHLNAAIENIVQSVYYWRVKFDGPKLGEITTKEPLIPRYFTDFGDPKDVKEYEEIMYSDDARFLMAHNGWVMDSDPLVNFASPESNVYIRRELIPWGDSVKLRYGKKPSDSPFLWNKMQQYIELTASVFDGIRLDNCHSTPLEVAEYMLDCARRRQPELYVVAELFTNSDSTDNIFINRLGITSLIREAMNANDSHELGRLVYRFGGIPVGSFYQPNIRPLAASVAHALFFDQTHDNMSPIVKTSVFNVLPCAALVNMAGCGTGSTRGHDELVPHMIDVVSETRQYTEWAYGKVEDDPKYASINSGIIRAKKALNDLHSKMGFNEFTEVYVDQMTSNVVAVTRHCPKTHRKYVLVAYTAFNHPHGDDCEYIRQLSLEGIVDEIVLEATMSHEDFSDGGDWFARSLYFEKDKQFINGLSEYTLHMKQHIQLDQSDVLEEAPSGNPNVMTALKFKNFQPGSIVILQVSVPEAVSRAASELRELAEQFSCTQESELSRIIEKLNLCDLNLILHRCAQEELNEKRFDTCEIPNYGRLVYTGLQGFINPLSKIRQSNDLGHPICQNLREGDWMIDYIFMRLKLDCGTAELGCWIETTAMRLKALPKYLKPAHFDLIINGLYLKLIQHSYKLMSSFVREGSTFVKALAQGSLQFVGYVKSAELPTLSPNLAPPRPETRENENGELIQYCPSLSAGLPRFSVGCMRNWGRDTFIALRGLLLLTGRYQEARYHILAYAACLRHGLIPNLLDGGRKPRYNCRDAVWWWLYCIKCYTEEAPNGVQILKDKVSRIFPTDNSPPQQPGVMDQCLQDVMQEALDRHFQGVQFRERNAGREIDEHMTDNGFNNQIGVHPDTGFVFGGNENNCGTWMDKMGSSTKAGNKGVPATPRDGSACEIVGLCKCTVSWLARMYDQGLYSYSGVERKHSNGKITTWTFKFWSDKIKENFEKYYWIPEVPQPIDGNQEQDPINKRGIYKDSYGATKKWADHQLRCNFPIVMTVAPELFDEKHAWTALQKAEKYLLGPLGMKTLDPDDYAYRGDYDNSNDSNDGSVAQGFNYHQGPEWIWPIGFFLRAKLHFAAKNGKLKETLVKTKCLLSNHLTELQTSDWNGLPELTNSNGSYCKDSCRTQAWSMSCLLEVLYDLQRIESST